jgi:P4 family phage/plasmid primase-like protien
MDAEEKAKRTQSIEHGLRAADKNNEPGHLAEQFVLHYYTSYHGQRLIHYFNNQFFTYTGTHYKKISDNILKHKVYRFVKEHAISKRTSGLLDITWKFVCADITLDEERKWDTWLHEPPIGGRCNFVGLRNGILDLDHPEKGVRPHTPEWLSRTCLPFSYDPAAQCLEWEKFMDSAFSEDEERKALLCEWFGYCLVPDNSLRKFMVYEGPTTAGKGLTADVQCHILGDDEENDNVSNIALEDLDKDFHITRTAGKLLNKCDETDQVERLAEAQLKRLTGDTGKFFFNVKHKEGFDEPVTARILILSNNGIPIYDRSQAVLARMLHLQYDKSHRDNPDTGLKARLFAEAPGIFRWALQGYARIQATRKFTIPRKSKEALLHYQEQSDPFKVWFEENVEVTTDEKLYLFKHRDVLAKHNDWLKEGGHKPIADNTCAKQIRLLVPGIKDDGWESYQAGPNEFSRARVWRGLKWRKN